MAEDESRYHSMNRETGMLEDIEEVRELVVTMTEALELVLSHPLVSLSIPYGMKLDLISMLTGARSLVRFTTQANLLREIAKATGQYDQEIEDTIRDLHLSETVPATHPEASDERPNLPPLDPEDPEVKSSRVLSHIAKERQDQDRKPVETPTPEPVELSTPVEEYLKNLFKED
jgi:hypothetical protein